MSRRIDIELTSSRDDGTWTWRAPGARQPKGTVDATLLPAGAKVGDVLRADAEFDLDGIVVTAVLAPRADNRLSRTDRIEILGSGRDRAAGGVSVVLAPGGRRRFDDGPDGRGGRDRPGRGRSSPRRDERGEDAESRRTGDAGDRNGRAERPGGRDGRPRRPDRTPGDRPARPGERSGRPGGRLEHDRGGPRGRADRGERVRRLQTVSTNRNAALADLRPEQLPVAEQLLRGGIPAVRNAIEEQNSRARAEGRAEVSPEPLLKMAEELLPAMNLATWKDRALAVRNAGPDAPLREVRSVVSASSTVTFDDEGRAMANELREALSTRVTALRDGWMARIVGALDDGRVLDALRVSARPPEPAARVPADLAVRLGQAAGAAMAGDVPSSDWLALLDAVVASPVRRTTKPAGLPADADDDTLAAARRAAGLVPEVARLLGLPIPPPPGPRRTSAPAARGA